MSESISNARLEANRANAQKSSGPRTRLGRSISCLNAVTCALTGATVVLPTDDAERYRAHILEYQGQFEPVGPEERALVQSIADTRWRLNRIPALEQAYLSTQEAELTKLADGPPLNPKYLSMREIRARDKYEKQIRNLHLHENRLVRRRERETAELLRLQAERKANEEQALAEAAKSLLLARHRNQTPAEPCRVGFDFTKRCFDTYLSRLTPADKQKLLAQALAEEAPTGQTLEAAA